MSIDKKESQRKQIPYRYNIFTERKLKKLKDSGIFNDYTEIIDTGINYLYEMIIMKKLPELPEWLEYEIKGKKDKKENK